MIKCQNLTVKVKGKTLLDNISITPSQGEITAVLGPNGSGKTTLLRTLSGNTLRYTGKVFVNDTDIKSITERNLAKMISYMPQVLPRPAVSAREMVSFSRFSRLGRNGVLSRSDWQVVDWAISQAGIEDKQYTQVCHLSGGERQMAYFAMIMAQQRQTIILDEPARGLDTNVKALFYSLVKRQKARGRTIILSMHDLNDACAIADKIMVLDKGKHIFTGTVQEFKLSDIPSGLFGMKNTTAFGEDGQQFDVFVSQNIL